MGTVFTIDIRDAGGWDDAVRDVVAWLHHVDAVFSTYRPDSDIAQLQRGERTLDRGRPGRRHRARPVRRSPPGDRRRTSRRCTADGSTRPGWSRAGPSSGRARCCAAGSRNHAVNGGGDVQTRGRGGAGPAVDGRHHRPARPRAHPDHVTGDVLPSPPPAQRERGRTSSTRSPGSRPSRLASATVVGPSLTYADAYATAAFVRGPDALRWIDAIQGYELLLAGADGRVRTSPGWPNLASSSASAPAWCG